jgi:hypothetical protein
MGIGIGTDIKQYPAEQNDRRHDAQGVAAEERTFAIFSHQDSMMIVRNR